MRKSNLGILMLVVSVILGIIGLLMDTTNGGVYNIGLMHRQSNLLMLSGFLFLGSLFVLLVGGRKEFKCESDVSNNPTGVLIIFLGLIIIFFIFVDRRNKEVSSQKNVRTIKFIPKLTGDRRLDSILYEIGLEESRLGE